MTMNLEHDQGFFFEILLSLNQAVPNHLADDSQTR